MASPELTARSGTVDEKKPRFEDGSQSKLSNEGVVDSLYAEVGGDHPGFTINDRRDMYRMGKVQELKVHLSKEGQRKKPPI
jgi:hypothetical protein